MEINEQYKLPDFGLIDELMNFNPPGFSKSEIIARMCDRRGKHDLAKRIRAKYGVPKPIQSDRVMAFGILLMASKKQ